ncbi:MAG: glycosyltransferase [Flammeovirgaceae bacterium]|jgi:spore maturation protein CgeB|nr:glycosyltransferase [Flammeovirgaceae bacterium]
MNFLFAGYLWKGSTSLQRLNAIKSILKNSHLVTELDLTYYSPNILFSFFYKASIKTGGYFDLKKSNESLLRKISALSTIDICWIEKGLEITRATLQQVKRRHQKVRLVFYSPDDYSNKANVSGHFIQAIALYDLIVTTKSYNVTELKQLGARHVIFIGNGFDPSIHRPLHLLPTELDSMCADVGFIGSWEKERFDSIIYLVENGVSVTVWGESWKKCLNVHPRLTIIPRNAWHDEYAKVLNATKINLCFLKKGNRDLQTTRSIEIPASGAFMLAEWTPEHVDLFQPDKEAVFFNSNEQLLTKAQYFLSHEAERAEIAKAGRKRCLTSGYSNEERLSQVLNYLNSIESL